MHPKKELLWGLWVSPHNTITPRASETLNPEPERRSGALGKSAGQRAADELQGPLKAWHCFEAEFWASRV